VDITDITQRPTQLADLVGAYEAGLGARLSQQEPTAISLAIARQPPVVHRGLGSPPR
jgi:hypothetical protein